MKPLFSNEDYINSKSEDKLPCECYQCNEKFYVMKKYIIHYFKHRNEAYNKNKFCSNNCKNLHRNKKNTVICSNCGNEFSKTQSQINKSKSNNHFCSRSCAATYNNTHKTKGNRVSKLELWLKEQLSSLYPDLNILYNNKKIINSELDIYIPSLNLAFELNGIFHYEPIYGKEKLKQIQNNDNRKFQACLEHDIELCIIDTSQQKYFKEKTSKKYLNVIISLINQRTCRDSQTRTDMLLRPR